ncbi:ATP-binding cassette domain-containing protein [Streptomyces mirabilis]|uniref:ATP-binding cassette domain-containing protein n=1 Tax=Streptomyces mirabilis TaxID=68239 RepID=UPI003659508D
MPLRRSTSCRHDARLTLQTSARLVSANHVQAATTRHRSHRPRLRISGDCKGYGRRQVLRDVDLDVSAGTLVGVVGENGAGESALLEIAVGHVAPDRGTVTRTGAVGYCPQRAVLNDAFTVGQHLRLFQGAYRLPTLERADELMELLALTGCLATAGRRTQRQNATEAEPADRSHGVLPPHHAQPGRHRPAESRLQKLMDVTGVSALPLYGVNQLALSSALTPHIPRSHGLLSLTWSASTGALALLVLHTHRPSCPPRGPADRDSRQGDHGEDGLPPGPSLPAKRLSHHWCA